MSGYRDSPLVPNDRQQVHKRFVGQGRGGSGFPDAEFTQEPIQTILLDLGGVDAENMDPFRRANLEAREDGNATPCRPGGRR